MKKYKIPFPGKVEIGEIFIGENKHPIFSYHYDSRPDLPWYNVSYSEKSSQDKPTPYTQCTHMVFFDGENPDPSGAKKIDSTDFTIRDKDDVLHNLRFRGRKNKLILEYIGM